MKDKKEQKAAETSRTGGSSALNPKEYGRKL